MNSLTKVLCVFATLILSLPIKAQFVDYGTEPSGYKWNIVRTSHYNLIYPEGIDTLAYRYISLLETAYPRVKQSLGQPYEKKFPVVLHPGNMRSNGLVAWAPRRMEMITTPSSDLYAQRWERQLAIHESRHVIQTGKLLDGYYKPIYYIIGEQAQGLASLLVPYWFLEGDAVATETALSKSGRGRLPEFNMFYRARRIDGDFFSFPKWNLGSFKDQTGTYYALGYNMTSYARMHYGNDIWDRVTTRYAKHFAIPPFAKALQHVAGISYQDLFDQTFNFLEKEWMEQEKEYQQSGFSPTLLSTPDKHYNAYQYPLELNDSTILALRTNFKDIAALVSINQGKEKHLTYLGTINSKIVLHNNRVYWTEYVSGTRWTHQNYSELKYYDLVQGKIRTITSHQRYLTPDIAPNGQTAILSTPSLNGDNFIVEIDLNSGKELKKIAVPHNGSVKDVVYTNNESVIVCSVDDNGICLNEYSFISQKWEELLAHTSANINALYWSNGQLFFESGLNGTNNIYSYKPSTKSYQRITTARFGAFTPSLSADRTTLLFSDYQKDGYRVAGVKLDDLNRYNADFNAPHRFELAEVITKMEDCVLDTLQLEDVPFEPKRYHKALNLFNFHSWAPFYYDVVDLINFQADDFSTILKPGATVISQNHLNTAISQLGWYYKDGYHHGKFVFNYSGLFPVFNFEIDYGGKAFNINWIEDEEGKRKTLGQYTGRNLVEAEAKVYVPINLTRNHYTRGIQPSVTYYLTNNQYEQYNSGKMRNFQYMISELRTYNYRKMATQDLLPRWGYQLRLQHMFSPFNKDNYGHLYLARLTTYWPGLVRGDGLMLRAAYQYQDLDNKHLYLPKKLMNEPRGYDYIYQTQQQMAFQADYSFKIFCPDVSITSMLFVQRLRANVFYDHYRNKANNSSTWSRQTSAGIDLMMDCSILQANFPMTFGARFIKPIDYGSMKVEGIFNISF